MPDENVSVPAPTDAAGAPSLPNVATDGAATSAPASGVGSDVTTQAAPVAPAVATEAAQADSSEVAAEVARRIIESHNVLVALSSDPSVDEMAAAIGLTLYLDKIGKRATAIYSGATPNALEFLKPEETFEPTVDALQDFVIALNKEKADHLRYKLDGDYVKIYITPYGSKISEEDLDFSYGDYNVDLVLALDVANGVDLDSALREHGRIMHDAVIVNITTSNPGKLGEVEWSDKKASSVSEMLARLLYNTGSDKKIEKEEATAFLTGIVAATNRFSNNKTTPDTMRLASKLMESGANQQLVSKNITPDVENEMFGIGSVGVTEAAPKIEEDPTKLDIEHDGEKGADESKVVDATVTEKTSTLLDDLKNAEASLAMAGAETTPEKVDEPLKIDSTEAETPQEAEVDAVSDAEEAGKPLEEASEKPLEEPSEEVSEKSSEEISAKASEADAGGLSEKKADDSLGDNKEKIIQPLSDMGTANIAAGEEDKYGHMLEEALKGIENSLTPDGQLPPSETITGGGAENTEGGAVANPNPAVASAPTVPSNPEINGVPEINYMPMPGDAVLPPPPTPPIDMDAPAPADSAAAAGAGMNTTLPPVEPIAPAVPVADAAPEPLGAQPAMQDQVYQPQASDPGAFKIPGT